MTYLEIRRHSTRRSGTIHLSQEGVDLARGMGAGLGPFAHVIVSSSAWSQETAIAMGFAFDEVYTPVQFTDAEWAALDEITPPPTTLDARANALRHDPLGQRYTSGLHSQWAEIASALPDGCAALVISHGGYTDSIAVACLPDADHSAWGEAFAHCEGIRLTWDGATFSHGAILRQPRNSS